MAVEAVIGVVGQSLFNQALSLATEEFSLSFRCKKSLQSLAREVEIIQALIVDADSKNIQSTVMQTWFKRLKDVMFDAEDLLEDYKYEILRQKAPQKKWEKVRNFFSPVRNLPFRSKITHNIKDINYKLKGVIEQGRQHGLSASKFVNESSEVKMDRVMTSQSIQEAEFVGRDADVAKVVEMLVNANNEENIALTAIIGMGGIGKTTVAQLVCKHYKVRSHFEKILWVCVSNDFKIERLLNEMVQSITHTNLNLTSRQALIGKLQETLKGKRYLVVFDDVWNENQQKWELMRSDLLEISGSIGTKILITTRSQYVTSIMHASQTHVLSKLSDNDSWCLFKKKAFAEGGVVESPQFVAIGQRLVKRCCGIALAIKVLGGLLSSKRDIDKWLTIEHSDIWSSINSEEGVISCIKLSYDHLPSLSLKQCFSYCSIFPKGTLMEKEVLIQQWMANGFLNPPNGAKSNMEGLGSDYFDNLLWNSLLQEPSYGEFSRTWTCKMHDIVHDFALHISKDYCFAMDEKHDVNDIIEAVHVSLTHNKMEITDIPKGISSKIRTLYLPMRVKYSSGDMLLKFGYLRTLILMSGYGVRKLPSSLGSLKLLRYIGVEYTEIKTLPASYIKLYNLQTLRLPWRFSQETLQVDTLVNLRHIYFREIQVSDPKCIIVGIKQLAHLQTLSHFIVSNKKGCRTDELENLNNLGGSLTIYGLDKVTNGEEARKANISKKLKIDHLHLRWTKELREVVNDEDVLEGLIPHSYLKTLSIRDFKGLNFPSWMKTTNNELLNNLIEFKLEDCDLLKQLPPLGHLPHLKKVFICELNNVKRIGAEFYGCTNYLRSSSCAFPALEILEIDGMSNLEEWLGVEHPSPFLQAFPHLRSLSIRCCGKLSVLPSFTGLTSLTDLSIYGNDELTELPSFQGLLSLATLSLREMQMLTELPSLEGLSSLTHLLVMNMQMLTVLPSLEGLSSLTHLLVMEMQKLTVLPSLEGLLSLTVLHIRSNKALTALPTGIQSCTSLERVTLDAIQGIDSYGLERLPNLNCLDIRGFSEEFNFFSCPHKNVARVMTSVENNEDNQLYFRSLKTLRLWGRSKLMTLPPQLQQLGSLTSLSINEFCGLEALPEWLCNIYSLSSLNLMFNDNLKYMPSEDAMKRLTNLHELTIRGCPHLKERCTRGSGPEWHKISHIQHISVDDNKIQSL